MHEDRHPPADSGSAGPDNATWAQMSPRERVLAAFGMAGLGVGVAGLVVLFLLLGVLVITVVCRPLIETDGPAALAWAALLCLPYGALASLFVHPLRLLVQATAMGDRARRAAAAGCSLAGTFLTALFVAALTPGLHVARSWIPALLATVLVAALNVALKHYEDRRNRKKRA
ncbi:hypothetical protein GCM10010218_60330 [Streptomyces mashuensis]|uniref:Uncharacterized protein n=1 Tax=Streptomyces mashuensis TaxID=33904 RepID=A0A919BA79_9ACTN|nr:hypothetical protein [Streptomyces mashuensis]GHF70929.1 hypothetical protein GCM10010218_60330 [Streptomyces mashuensis]